MAQNNLGTGAFNDTGTEQLVVDLPYVDFVAERLRNLGGDVRVIADKQDRVLGLGVVAVDNIERLAATISSSVMAAGVAEDRWFPPREPSRSNLDTILIELRYQFRRDFNGWTPEIGRNRTMYGVHGSPHIGGSGYPEPAVPPELRGSPRDPVGVGLVDTKVYPLSQFGGRVVSVGNSIFSTTGPFSQQAGHGTFSTGLILKEAPWSVVTAHGVLSDYRAVSTVWEVATALAGFADRDVAVIVLPLVCYVHDGSAPLALQRAVNTLRNEKVVLAAAGNHGDAPPDQDGRPANNLPGFPAACDGAVAVGAVSTIGGVQRASFSPDSRWVQLVAPGENITSTFVRGYVEYEKVGDKTPPPDTDFDGGATWSGTSFATATIGGRIASQVVPGRKSAFEVLHELLEADPRRNDGIGAFSRLI